MFETGIGNWITGLITAIALPFQDEVEWTFSEKIWYFIQPLFNLISGFFQEVFGYKNSYFSDLGNSITGSLDINFLSNFFTFIIGFIFALFVFKIVISKAIDLISRIVDLT